MPVVINFSVKSFSLITGNCKGNCFGQMFGFCKITFGYSDIRSRLVVECVTLAFPVFKSQILYLDRKSFVLADIFSSFIELFQSDSGIVSEIRKLLHPFTSLIVQQDELIY